MLDRYSIKSILSEIKYKDWQVDISKYDDSHYLLYPYFHRPDSITGEYERCKNMRPWVIETYRSEAYLVQTVFAMFKMAEEHEVRENFKYKGEALYSPHNIDRLLV